MFRAVHDDGRGPVFEVAMRSRRCGSKTVRHVVCKKPNADRFENTYNKYVVLCTNIPLDWMQDAPRTLLRIYGRRWRIETRYRIMEQVQGKTRSRAYQVRLSRFFMMLVYANVWLMLNAMREGRRENGVATRRTRQAVPGHGGRHHPVDVWRRICLGAMRHMCGDGAARPAPRPSPKAAGRVLNRILQPGKTVPVSALQYAVRSRMRHCAGPDPVLGRDPHPISPKTPPYKTN